MPFTYIITAVLLASRTVTATSSISLSDFLPRIQSLPAPCSTVYNQVVRGCVAADFDAQKKRCSANCVQGLVEISHAVSTSCSKDDVSETSMIGVFLHGQGISILCPGVSVTTIGDLSSTKTSTSTTSTKATSAQDEPLQSSDDASSSTASSAPVTNAASTETSILTQPAPTTSTTVQSSFIWSLPADSSTTAPTQTASSQKSNLDSGGGSPFDVMATGSGQSTQSRQHRRTVITGVILGMAVLACVAI